MNTCPCCSNTLLRHIRHHQVYWFCRHCWQEMPVLECQKPNFFSTQCFSMALQSPHRDLALV